MATEQMPAVINGWMLLAAASYNATYQVPTIVNLDEDIFAYAEIAFINKPSTDGNNVAVDFSSSGSNNSAQTFSDCMLLPALFPGNYVPIIVAIRNYSSSLIYRLIPATCRAISIYGSVGAYTPGTLYIYGRK